MEYNWCFYKREETQRHRHVRGECDDRGQGWSDAVTSQEMPRIDGQYQKVGRGRKDSTPSLREGFPGGAVVENLPASAGDMASIPSPGRSYMPRSS